MAQPQEEPEPQSYHQLLAHQAAAALDSLVPKTLADDYLIFMLKFKMTNKWNAQFMFSKLIFLRNLFVET